MKTVWIVKYGNYEPAEIHSIHKTKEGADKVRQELGGMWEVEEWELEE